MPRRYRSRTRIYRPLRTLKYNPQTMNFNSLNQNYAQATTYGFPVVVASDVGGVRKVKNFTLSVNTDTQTPVFIALVYVPFGVNAGNLNLAAPPGPNATDLYSPSQNIILSGIVQDGQPIRLRSYLARNLNAGDQIAVLYGACITVNNVSTLFNVSFAITY